MRAELRKTFSGRASETPAFVRRLLLTLCGVGLVAAFATNSPAQSPEPAETIRIDTHLVNLNVSVFDRDAAPQTGALEPKDFAIFENGAPQEISFFESAETPFDLVLLLDLSGSTADKIGLIRKSSKRFVDAARPGDRIAIVTFTDTAEVISPLTLDHAALKKSVDDIEKPSGGTNFWDSLRFVVERVLAPSRAENRRGAVVVMTDGVDNALPDVFGEGSRTSFEELIDIVRRSDAIVLPIFLDTEKEEVKRHRATPGTYVLARRQLNQLAAESGNTIYRAEKVKDLEGVYEQVMRDLSTVYSIGYRPSVAEHDGSWRAVTVQLVGHPTLLMRAKRGYFAK
jgi:VWFA-related protein